jgi:hypothetical protein
MTRKLRICPRCGSAHTKEGTLLCDCLRCGHYGPMKTFMRGGPDHLWTGVINIPRETIIQDYKFAGLKVHALIEDN